jgi:hypothetical protein
MDPLEIRRRRTCSIASESRSRANILRWRRDGEYRTKQDKMGQNGREREKTMARSAKSGAVGASIGTSVGMNVIAVSGRRIDAENSPTARFPLDHVDAVRDAIRALVQQTHTGAIVSSAACGADLLTLAVADELGLRAEVILPFSPERFRATSVTDRPGDWGPLFDRLVGAAQRRGALIIIQQDASAAQKDQTDHEAYLRTTEILLEHALDLAQHTPTGALADTPGLVTALVIWEGAPRGPSDLTAHFAATAEARGIPIHTIHT